MSTATAVRRHRRLEDVSPSIISGTRDLVLGTIACGGCVYLAYFCFTTGGGWIVLGVFACIWATGAASKALLGVAEILS